MPLEQHLEIRRQRLDDIRVALAPVIARSRALTWEVGCGHGHFLTAYAEAHPDESCVGIDLLSDRLERAEKKRSRAGLANLFWVRAEATLFLEALPPDVVLPKTWVLFPDPWPKKRHWKNRLLQPGFLTTLGSRTPPGGLLCFRTDHAPYFAEACAAVTDHPLWSVEASSRWPFEMATVFQQRAAGYQSLVAMRSAIEEKPSSSGISEVDASGR